MTPKEPLVVGGRPIDRTRLAAICHRYGVVELAVFGSVARETEHESSDLDLLYVLAPDARLGFQFSRLEDELAELFGRPVDLVARRSIHKLLRKQVPAEAQTLHAA